MRGDNVKTDYFTDEQVEREIERLKTSPAVLLAKQEQRILYKRRQYMYKLRGLEKRGKQLIEQGITYETLKALEEDIKNDTEER